MAVDKALQDGLKMLGKMKTKMAAVMAPKEHAEFCEMIDQKRQQLLKELREAEFPDYPSEHLNYPQLQDERIPADRRELLDKFKDEPPEVAEQRALFEKLQQVEFEDGLKPEVKQTRDWTTLGIRDRDAPRSTEMPPEFVEWVFHSLVASAEPPERPQDSMAAENLVERLEEVTGERPSADAPEQGGDRERLRKSFSSFHSWFSQSTIGSSGLVDDSSEESAKREWEKWKARQAKDGE